MPLLKDEFRKQPVNRVFQSRVEGSVGSNDVSVISLYDVTDTKVMFFQCQVTSETHFLGELRIGTWFMYNNEPDIVRRFIRTSEGNLDWIVDLRVEANRSIFSENVPEVLKRHWGDIQLRKICDTVFTQMIKIHKELAVKGR